MNWKIGTDIGIYTIDACVFAKSLQLCPTLCDSMDCSPPGSFVHGILQARTLEWAAMPSSRGSSQPRDRTHISYLLHWHQALYCQRCLGSPHCWWCVKQVTNENLLYHTGHCVQSSMVSWMGSKSKKERHICREQIHFAVRQKLKWHCKAIRLS